MSLWALKYKEYFDVNVPYGYYKYIGNFNIITVIDLEIKLLKTQYEATLVICLKAHMALVLADEVGSCTSHKRKILSCSST